MPDGQLGKEICDIRARYPQWGYISVVLAPAPAMARSQYAKGQAMPFAAPSRLNP